jgi:hypothetical protein
LDVLCVCARGDSRERAKQSGKRTKKKMGAVLSRTARLFPNEDDPKDRCDIKTQLRLVAQWFVFFNLSAKLLPVLLRLVPVFNEFSAKRQTRFIQYMLSTINCTYVSSISLLRFKSSSFSLGRYLFPEMLGYFLNGT